MKKSAALLLIMGLVCAPVTFALDITPAPPGSSSDHHDVKKFKAADDYVTLNFTNIDINALVKVMSELTHRNFLLDEKVTGKVTIMTPNKISPEEAYQVFLSALEIKGFTAIEDGSVNRIIPAASARQSGLKVVQDGDGRGEGFVTKLIRLTYVNPQELVRTISPLVTKDGQLIAYPATNSVIITDSVYNIRKMESLIRIMDVVAQEGKGRINVYYLKNANADEIAKIMTTLLAKLPIVSPASPAASSPASILEGTVSITSDKATNSLIIVASVSDFETVKDVIQKLDIRRRQVYVEAAIIEMSLNKQRELGFEMQIPINQGQLDAGKTVGVGGTNFGNIGNAIAGGPAALASMNGLAVGAVKGTFQFKGVEYFSVGALLRAVQTDADVNVLSTPNILTMDNQKAEIMVGQNVPFLTGQTQNATTGSGNLFNTIERKDVGIKLSITPQIASDDNVRLDVNQEISDVVGSSSANAAGPITSKRSASTTVVVKDRQTMVIGGLIRDNVVSTTTKVPFLGDIPILGWLFKYKTTQIEKTNLMIFITPYIIKNAEDSENLTQQKSEALEKFRKDYRIEKKDIDPGIKSRTSTTLGMTGSAEKPASQMSQELPELKPASDQQVRSSVTTTRQALPELHPVPEQSVETSPTTTQPFVPAAAPKKENVR